MFSKIIGTGSYGHVYYPCLYYLDISSENVLMPPLRSQHHPYDRPTVGQGCAHTERRARTPMLPFYERPHWVLVVPENPKNRNKYVSKLLKKEYAEKELLRYQLIRSADPNNNFHLGNMFVATPSRRNIPLLSIGTNGKEIVDHFNEYQLIIMKYGGKSLREYGKMIYYDKNKCVNDTHKQNIIQFWKDSIRLIEGIHCFIQNNIVHHDIKTANIVFCQGDFDPDVNAKNPRQDSLDDRTMDVVSVAKRSDDRRSSTTNVSGDFVTRDVLRITTHILKDYVGVQKNMEELGYRSNYIDFGLTQNMKSIYEKSKNSMYNYSIFYYNFPPELFLYDKERFDKLRNFNMEERKLWFQYICTSWIHPHEGLQPSDQTSPGRHSSKSGEASDVHKDDFDYSFMDSTKQAIKEMFPKAELDVSNQTTTNDLHNMLVNFQNFLLYDIDKYPGFKSFMINSLYTMDIYGLGQTLLYMLTHTYKYLPISFVEKMHILLRKMTNNNVTERITIKNLIFEYKILLQEI